jgi:hypothetical protein
MLGPKMVGVAVSMVGLVVGLEQDLPGFVRDAASVVEVLVHGIDRLVTDPEFVIELPDLPGPARGPGDRSTAEPAPGPAQPPAPEPPAPEPPAPEPAAQPGELTDIMDILFHHDEPGHWTIKQLPDDLDDLPNPPEPSQPPTPFEPPKPCGGTISPF